MMQYGKVKYVAKKVSRFVMGTMILGKMEFAESDKLLDDIFETGVNSFDTAPVYGANSEINLGHWIKERGNREKVVIITKCAHHNEWRKRVTPFDIYADMQDSIARMGVDYVDIYLLHRDDPDVPVGPIVETLNRLYDSGRIRAFGGSNWAWDRIDAANEYAAKYNMIGFSVSSPNYSLAVQEDNPWGPGCVTLSGDANKKEREFYLKTQMPVFAYSSMGRGFFSGAFASNEREIAARFLDVYAQKGYMYADNFERLRRVEELAKAKKATVPQVATAWLMKQPQNTFAIVGAKSKDEMNDNINAFHLVLSVEELAWINLEIEMPE